jgi:hypothetical protein
VGAGVWRRMRRDLDGGMKGRRLDFGMDLVAVDVLIVNVNCLKLELVLVVVEVLSSRRGL